MLDGSESKVCPVTGLALTARPEWSNVQFSDGYSASFEVIGPNILHTKIKGALTIDLILSSSVSAHQLDQ